MKCENCGKKINKKNEFCPHCGSKIEKVVPCTDVVQDGEAGIKEVNDALVVKKPKQVFKVIVIVYLVQVFVVLCLLTYFFSQNDSEQIIANLWNYDEWKAINIITFFLPTIILFLVMTVGWLFLCLIDVINLIIAGLTMIKASKIKKIILLVLMICFLILGIIAIIFRPESINNV